MTGFDLVDLARFRESLAARPRLVERLFTEAERAYCGARPDPVPHFAARFAAKEAVAKLLGFGELTWHEVEVLAPAAGLAPQVRLSGRMADLAARRGVTGVAVSLTHTATVAGASVVATMSGDLGPARDEAIHGRHGSADDEEVQTVGHAATDPFALVGVQLRPGVFSPAQVRELDRRAIGEVGIPGPVLMERAALGITRLVLDRYPGRHTLIVCGRGNNGGDGLAAARQLHLAGHPVACVVAAASADELSPDAQLNLAAAQGAGVNVRLGSAPEYLWDEAQLVVDCLLGTGASGELREPLAEWARRVNDAGARGVPVVAVDVPSGVDAGDGSMADGTVAADCTVTFHAAKPGLVCPPGSEAAGEVLVWDIGLPTFLEPEPVLRVVTAADVAVPGRRVDDHKYTAGFVAVVAGSAAYSGAAYLASRAAARSGAGYVRLVTPGDAATAVRERLVEIVVTESGPGEVLAAGPQLDAALDDPRLGALIVGPGLGRAAETVAAVREVVCRPGPPLVLDADGLFAFAADAGALRLRAGLVLTPHAGELAQLLGVGVSDVTASALTTARRGAEATGQVVVLKGSSTVIAAPDGRVSVVVQGPPQLASAGTGDVLAGCVGAFLAKGLDPFEAASAACWVHAEAGRLWASRRREGLVAADLIELLPDIVSAHVTERRPGWTI